METQRRARHQWLDEHLLGAERAADRRRRDADPARREVEQRRERVAGVEQALRARCDHEGAVIIDPRRRSVRLDVALVDPRGGEAAVDHYVCGGERSGGVAVGDVVPLAVPRRRLHRRRPPRRGQARAARHRRGRPRRHPSPRLPYVRRPGDRLAREHSDIPCQRHGAPPIANRGNAEVVRSEDRDDAGHREGGRGIDGPDSRVRRLPTRRRSARGGARQEPSGLQRSGRCLSPLASESGARSRDPDDAEVSAVPATVCHLRILRCAGSPGRSPWLIPSQST